MKVVLVDPSRTMQKAVTSLLEARGHTVASFADGRKALMMLRDDDSCEILITSSTPFGMSGNELCWEARLLAGMQRPIYIIMMSSNRGHNVLCEALDSGADDYIAKPPQAEELYARMRAAERLVHMERELGRLATTDPLTGKLNRRAFLEAAQEACVNALGSDSFGLVMMDIDHFKRINDVFGHDGGDKVLCAVADTAAEGAMAFGRIGGEEFAFLVPVTDPGSARACAEAVRLRVADMTVETQIGTIQMTCSFGVAEWDGEESVERLLKRADLALYEAKEAGRNRVAHAPASAGTRSRTSSAAKKAVNAA
jgi:two-component system, cell cycle response regulator